MVAIKSLIVPAFIFLEGVQSYCIYNDLYNASFYIIHRYEHTPYRKLFKKTLEPGTSECCPYTQRDCSFLRENYYAATFDITFDWPTHRSEVYSVTCTTGGALVIRGSEDDHYAICKSVGFVDTNPPFIPKPSE